MGTLESQGAQAAGWAACSCHSAPWFWRVAAAAGGHQNPPATGGSRRSAGTNPHPDGFPTGRPVGDGTRVPVYHSPQSHWQLLLPPPPPPPAPDTMSSHQKASRSCRSMLSSACLGEVATSSCALVLVENRCWKTIWHQGSRDGVFPTFPCNLT